jgi:AAA domain, putative AbiEii toxin, Type IV TA system/AAA ATPase domain
VRHILRNLKLLNFKGFERFEVSFPSQTWLVGPNNAGKSTIIAALRTVARMAAQAQRRQFDHFAMDGIAQVPAHAFASEQFGLVGENLRHEFRDVETRIQATFKDGASLVAVWPASTSDQDAFFYIRSGEGVQVRTTAAARAALPSIGVIPILSPVEHEEGLLSADYVRANLSGRLASRHTRNQLRRFRTEDAPSPLYDNRLAEFLAWAEPWSLDFRVRDVVQRNTDDGVLLDVFCSESGSRTEKELFWAGDGVQVWIQLLMHLFRSRERDVIVLDEPDLYLHADLQRRLVRLLESLDAQTIAASHSAEVLVEAPPASVTWISRDRRRAVRAPSERVASDLTAAIGSQFNLRLARALRARAVLFVEGDDMRVLRNVASTLGATKMAGEVGLVTIPLRGFSNWEHVEPFSWLLTDLLERAVRTMVILDRDFRSDDQVTAVEDRLRRADVSVHVWRRKELESYLLVASAIARRSGSDEASVQRQLLAFAENRKEEVFAQILAERLKTEVSATNHMTQVTQDARRDFDQRWAVASDRPHLCKAKAVLSDLNAWLQTSGHKTVSARTLSTTLKPGEVPWEMTEVIRQAEELTGA